MAQNTEKTRLWLGTLALVVMGGLGIWVYLQFNLTLNQFALSNRLLENSWESQNTTVNFYKQEVALLQDNLSRTENLLAQMKDENGKLRQKLVLLDTVSELEETIARLKEKNALLVNHISLNKGDSEFFVNDIKSLTDAKKTLTKYDKRLRQIKGRMRELKLGERDQRMARQKENDRLRLLTGNNGFLVRQGKISSMEYAVKPPGNRDAKIDVTFVK